MPSVQNIVRWACVFLVACSPAASAPVLNVGGAAAANAVAQTETEVRSTVDACMFKIEAFQVAPHTSFCVAGTCFAELDESIDAHTVLRVPSGPIASLGLELESGALRVRGTIRAADLLVAPKRAMMIDGWITPFALGSVKLRSGSSTGDLEIEVRDSEELELAAPVVASRRCYELAFDEVEDVDEDVVLDALAGDVKRTNLTGHTFPGGRLPVSRTPGGPQVAVYKTREDTDVEILETTGTLSRILVRTERVAFSGWVPTAMVQNNTLRGHSGDGTIGLGRIGTGPSGKTCPHDIPLFVRVSGEKLVRVGEVIPNHSFDLDTKETKDGRIVIEGRTGALKLLPGMTFEIMPADLRACAEDD